jgi:hypothetical protein
VAQKLTAGFPRDLDLAASFVIQLTAVDPTSGAVVAGVNVSNVAIVAAPVTPATADNPGPLIVPLEPQWINVPQTG